MKRLLLALTLIAIPLNVLGTGFRVERVSAIGPIYVRADGSVDPQAAPIMHHGDIYSLIGDITGDAGGIVIERDNMTLDGANWAIQGTGTSIGIDLTGRVNVTIQNVKISAFYYGIVLDSSSNNTISQNLVTANRGGGIVLSRCQYNSIVENNVTANVAEGIFLVRSSNYNSIDENSITTNNYGVSLYLSSNNSIYGNNIAANNWGVHLHGSSDNLIYHNNFANNGNQVFIVESADTWDRGYPSGGNYWSNYEGVDLNSGVGQNLTGNDGIADAPYLIDTNNKDQYPLMIPHVTPEDINPPAISLLFPENKTYNANQISLVLSINESASWIGYSLDGEGNVTIDGNVSLNGLPDGKHSIRAFANDTAGNMDNSETIYFTVDTMPPITRILSPENKTYTTKIILVAFDIDESASWIGYSLDGQANKTIYTGNTTIGELSNGSHNLVIYATDTAGNVGVSERQFFSIDVPRTEALGWILAAIGMTAVIVLAVYITKRTRADTRGGESNALCSSNLMAIFFPRAISIQKVY